MASSTSALPAVSAAVPPPPPPKMPSQLNPAPAKTTNAAAPISPQRQLQFTGDGGARPPMSTRGRRAIAAGFAVLVLSVSEGVNLISGSDSAFALLLSFAGVLTGVNVLAVGVRFGKDAAPVGHPAVFTGAGAPPAFLRRNLAVVGLLVASSAVAAVAGEAGPAICFMTFVLLLLGVSLINAGVRGAY